MSSFEFLYVRLTAQTASMDPRVQGNRPEFSRAFVAQMAGRIKPRSVYHAALSFYCDDLGSIGELNLGMANWCWKRIQEKHPDCDYKALKIARVTELAVLMYLYPWMEEDRSDVKCAAWVQVAPQTWKKKYSHQRDIMVYELAQMKSDGDWKLSVIMREGGEQQAV